MVRDRKVSYPISFSFSLSTLKWTYNLTLTDRPMRKVKYFTHKENIMEISVLEMNGDRIERNLNYLPSNRGYYSIVIKGEKQQRFSNAEETLSYLNTRKDEAIHAFVKVPCGMKSVSLNSLRIA